MKRRNSSHRAGGFRFGIVAAKFNPSIMRKLLTACLDELVVCRVAAQDIELVRVPGAFELPLVAKAMAKSGRFDAVICLGAVIRGNTPHFEYISAEVSRGIGQAALDTEVPIIFGVLTTETVAQATERADPKKFNRGGDAAKCAIEMALLMRKIRGDAERLERGTSSSPNRRAAGRTQR